MIAINGPSGYALLDGLVLEEVRRNTGLGGEEAMRSLLAGFREEARQQITRISEAARGSDGERLRGRAACLRQAASAVGASRVAALCSSMEHAGSAGDLDDVPEILDELTRAVDATLAAFGRGLAA